MSDTETYSGEHMSYTTGFTVTFTQPKTVGHWDIGGTRFAVFKTPNKFHKFMVKLLFGWEFLPVTKSTTTRQMLHG